MKYGPQLPSLSWVIDIPWCCTRTMVRQLVDVSIDLQSREGARAPVTCPLAGDVTASIRWNIIAVVCVCVCMFVCLFAAVNIDAGWQNSSIQRCRRLGSLHSERSSICSSIKIRRRQWCASEHMSNWVDKTRLWRTTESAGQDIAGQDIDGRNRRTWHSTLPE